MHDFKVMGKGEIEVKSSSMKKFEPNLMDKWSTLCDLLEDSIILLESEYIFTIWDRWYDMQHTICIYKSYRISFRSEKTVRHRTYNIFIEIFFIGLKKYKMLILTLNFVQMRIKWILPYELHLLSYSRTTVLFFFGAGGPNPNPQIFLKCSNWVYWDLSIRDFSLYDFFVLETGPKKRKWLFW